MMALRTLSPVLVLCAGCTPAMDNSRSTEHTDCLLNRYQLSELSHPVEQDGNFDTEDNLYGMRVEIPATIVANQISGYKAEVTVGSSKQPQFLYLTFSEPYKTIRFERVQAEPVEESGGLFRIPGDSQYHWDLAKQTEDGLVLWGSCSDNFQGSFDCMMHLPVDGVALNYELDQANLPVYREVEEFIRDQMAICGFEYEG